MLRCSNVSCLTVRIDHPTVVSWRRGCGPVGAFVRDRSGTPDCDCTCKYFARACALALAPLCDFLRCTFCRLDLWYDLTLWHVSVYPDCGRRVCSIDRLLYYPCLLIPPRKRCLSGSVVDRGSRQFTPFRGQSPSFVTLDLAC